MSVPKYYEFMKPMLVLIQDGKEHKLHSLYEELADYFKLSDEDRAEYIPSGKQPLYHNRIGWAKTYLVKAGLAVSIGRAVIRITNTGKAAVAENPNIIDRQYLMRYPQFMEFMNLKSEVEKPIQHKEVPSDDRTPLEDLVDAYKIIYGRLQDDLLLEVFQLSPDRFERLVVDLVVAMGYGGTAEDAARVVGKTGDEGIDGIIKADRLGFDRIYIQAKKWDPSKTIGRPEIHKFLGAIVGQGASKGLFISTCNFTKDAIEFVEKTLTQRMVLVDGKQLTRLMIEHNLGVSTQFVYDIKSVDRDYFSNGF